MSQELYSYLQGLHTFIQEQEKRIRSLEKSVRELQEETKTLKERPPISIGRIDYKFDQLKVETLEGTLNIGLNPSDLQNIDDLAVDNQENEAPISPKKFMKKTMEIENEIYRYLESDLPAIVSEVQRNLQVAENETYLSFIKEDIKKQLPNRIDFHLKQLRSADPAQEENRNINEEVIQQLKAEIKNGVHAFISHLPENMKGMKKE
ncbi:spore germination protein GerPC [Cytobacillus sp. FJAT-53684]|uniref:Spore germination protein GerPC n=1 Tax=Cytobacillus mangrovibacter TaxID=3299024 RepID=A0ABW6K039_9BACI